MSRCARTEQLLDAAFAGVDLTRRQAKHLAACAECARALALLRRFDSRLGAVGRQVAPERLGAIHDLIGVSIPREGDTVSWRNGLMSVAGIAALLLAVLVTSGLGEGWPGGNIGRVLGLRLHSAEAASAFRIPEDAVVIVGDDAVGLRIRDLGNAATFELLLMDATDRRVRQVYETELRVPADSAGMFSQAVRCLGVLEGDVYALVAMGWPGPQVGSSAVVGGPSGQLAEFRTSGGRLGAVFVADADAVGDETVIHLRIGGGESRSTLGHDAVECAQPATATCRDWEQWETGTRASLTEWLVETRLEPVRTVQHLPANATDGEVVNAAVGSIDKSCQGSPADRRLADVVERLYD